MCRSVRGTHYAAATCLVLIEEVRHQARFAGHFGEISLIIQVEVIARVPPITWFPFREGSPFQTFQTVQIRVTISLTCRFM